jgi:hypothetical protein
VELDGVPVGATSFEKDSPGGYFHRTHTAWGQRLEHPLVARVSLPGFATREIVLAEGPILVLQVRSFSCRPRNHRRHVHRPYQ